MSGTAHFDVTPELLASLLNMPRTARIVSVASIHDPYHLISITVADTSIPDGHHRAEPTVTEHQPEWNWNLKAEGA